jgi:haloalkane dehalogenase
MNTQLEANMNEQKAIPTTSIKDSRAFTEHRIPRNESWIYAREYPGTGPAFVLLHGFPDNLHIYDLLIPELLAKGRHVVAFDFLGFGASDKPLGGTYSFQQQLEDLGTVVEFLQLGEVVPVGHDAGGIAAIDYALANPGRVARLCLLNTFYAAAPTLRIPELIVLFAVPELKALADAMAADPKQMAFLLALQQTRFKLNAPQTQVDTINNLVEPIIRANFFQEHSALPAFAQLAAMAYAQVQKNGEHLDALGKLPVPSTIIWGSGDSYLTTDVGRDLAAHMQGATFHELAAGHWPQLDSSGQVAAFLLAE